MTLTSNRRRFLQGTAVLGGAGALAACSQQSSEEQAEQAAEENEQKAAEQAELPSTAWTRAEYDDVEDGGTLRLAVSQLPNNWNGSHADGALVDRSRIVDPMIGSGIIFTEDGEWELDSNYLVSAEVTSEDPQIVTVKYNPDAVWENGDPVTIEDLIAYAKALKGDDDAYQVASTVGWEQIKEVRQTDDEFTGEIEFESPYADWITLCYPEIPHTISDDPEEFNEGYVDKNTPSNGPFMVDSIDNTAGVVTLKRNDKWWGRAPKLETIIFTLVSQQQLPSAFANGELDALDGIADGDTYSQATSRDDVEIQKSNGVTWNWLGINLEGGDGILADEKVREAIARGVNREAVGEAVVGPLDSPVILKDHFVFMPGQDGYEDSYEAALGDPLTFDPERAGELLDEAGWELGDGDVRTKDGEELALSFLIPADVKSNSDRARQMQSDLNEIGFNVELETVPADAYFDEYIHVGDFDLITPGWQGTQFPETSSSNIYYPHSSAQNYTSINLDDEVGDLVDTMKSETDEEARLEATNEFSQAVAQTFSTIPLYAVPKIFAVAEGIVNYGAALFETFDWTQVGYISE